MSERYFLTPQDAQQVEMLPRVHRRTMATTDRLMVCEFFLERDAIIPPHSHVHDQAGYLVYGTVELTIGGQTRTCQPGDSYAIPGGIVHNVKAVVDSLVVEVFTPLRDEYRSD